MGLDVSSTYIGDIYEMFHYPCAFLRVFPGQDGLRYPISNLREGVRKYLCSVHPNRIEATHPVA